MTIREYRKTATIKAEQFTGEHEQVFKYGMFPSVDNCANEFQYFLPTKEGDMRINLGDWIATGEKGEHWAIKDDIFRLTYELVEDQEMKKEEKSVIPVVKRVKEEKADLDKKIKKLKTFLNDDEKLSNIGKEQVNLLRCQLEVMEKYSDILWDRINDLEETEWQH